MGLWEYTRSYDNANKLVRKYYPEIQRSIQPVVTWARDLLLDSLFLAFMQIFWYLAKAQKWQVCKLWILLNVYRRKQVCVSFCCHVRGCGNLVACNMNDVNLFLEKRASGKENLEKKRTGKNWTFSESFVKQQERWIFLKLSDCCRWHNMYQARLTLNFEWF